jgi:cobalamin biosynthetic protein CobC
MKHGGDLTAAMARHGGQREDWLDLSTGINPHAYPLPPMDARVWTELPGAAALERFHAAARAAYAAPAAAGLVAAPGTQALIQWLPRLLPAGTIAIVGPTYAEHGLSWRQAGSDVLDITADALERGLPDGVRHLLIVRPNNPDGLTIGLEVVARLAEETGKRGGHLILDESFIAVTPDETAAPLTAALPVIVLRSFGKFHGLAGIRLGAMIAAQPFADAMRDALGPWAVSGPALAIGAEALADRAWADAMRIRLAEEARLIDEILMGCGLNIVGGTPLFRLARLEDAWRSHERLAAQRIWARRFDWDRTILRFGLPPDAESRERLRRGLAMG